MNRSQARPAFGTPPARHALGKAAHAQTVMGDNSKSAAFERLRTAHHTEAVATAEVELLTDDVGEKLTRLDRDARWTDCWRFKSSPRIARESWLRLEAGTNCSAAASNGVALKG